MPQHPKPIVLIVEDEPLIRMLAVDAFLDAGFVVLEAEDAAEALEIYGRQLRVHILFTDVNMPGEMNGIDLAEQLKALGGRLEVIITSALPVLRSVGHIPAVFIAKPYRAPDVCSAARNLLAA